MSLKTYYLVLLILFSVEVFPANGCVKTKASPSLELKMADAVFSGEVTAIEYQSEGNLELQRIRVKTRRWWKGIGSDEIMVNTNQFRKFDGNNWQIWHYPNALDFTAGEIYLIFAFVDSKKILGTTKCNGTKLLSDAKLDLTGLGEGFLPKISPSHKF